jgi:hypothetical protein
MFINFIMISLVAIHAFAAALLERWLHGVNIRRKTKELNRALLKAVFERFHSNGPAKVDERLDHSIQMIFDNRSTL